jgi:hypothetical protein
MDTLSLTINSTILFALGFVVYAIIYEICATTMGRKEVSPFSGQAYPGATPSFVRPKAGVISNLPKHRRTRMA